MTAMTGPGPSCREIRQLLGVYVVGAIDPAERAIVDLHLQDCPGCREELSGLAGLPALLGRVPREDVLRMGEGGVGLPDMDEPPAELLNSLLRRVAGTRRTRRWRSALALAAAVAIAAGGTTAIVNAVRPAPFHDTDQAASGQLAAVVDYSSTPWGMAMNVGVKGVPANSVCTLLADQSGHWVVVGRWRSRGPEYMRHWYPLQAPGVPAQDVRGFKITSQGKTLLQIPD
jgi:hypothetical protein